MNNKFSMKSKIKDIYKNPVGKDLINKLLLQIGKSQWFIKNPIVMNLTLSKLKSLSKGKISTNFLNTIINLLNSNNDLPVPYIMMEDEKRWWKEAVFYQIYPKSFMDSNDDGIGDIKGIILKLDYLKSLGVDAIWLCPIYDTPFDDNGYDIRDYYKIAKEYGTMDDFNELLNEAHKRDMRIIMDLVVNHTSDEHKWFKEALEDKTSPYRKYYHFRNGREDTPPNNWTSFFSGPAWNYYKENNEWVLHLFSKKQMDLNWDSKELRKEIHNMIRWWLEKGVDGFRLDVINYISKEEGLPDGDELIKDVMGFCGVEHFFYGPHLHEYLREINREAFKPYNAFSVGETPGIGIEMGRLLTAKQRKELDMVFAFDILEMPGYARFDKYVYDLNYMKKYLIEWMENYADSNCWMSLFFNNHDNPRMLSKIDPSNKYTKPLAELLATIQLTMRGTPFIYQGEELGSTNTKFNLIDEFKDIESLNLYNELIKTLPEKEAFQKVLYGSRDHARIPMQWDDTENLGFSKGEPWLRCNSDCFNAKCQIEDELSILNFYKKLIKIRKENEALIYGKIKFTNKYKKDILTYYRENNDCSFYIECNLSSKKIRKPNKNMGSYTLVISNYAEKSDYLNPYEANIYKL